MAFDLSCFVFFSVVAFLLFVRLRFFLHFLCPICCSWIPLIVYLDSCHDTLLLLLNLYFVFLNHFLTLIKPMVYTPNLPLKFPSLTFASLWKLPSHPSLVPFVCSVVSEESSGCRCNAWQGAQEQIQPREGTDTGGTKSGKEETEKEKQVWLVQFN